MTDAYRVLSARKIFPKPTMSIAQTLPVEILAAVFEYGLIPDAKVPASSASLLRPLSHVCSQWYSAARAYSALWRDISTRVDSPAWVDAALARASTARDLRLDVTSDLHMASSPVPTHVARLLAEAGRARCITLTGPALAGRLRYLPQGPLLRLTDLVLSTHHEPSLDPEDAETFFQHEMPRLTTLDIVNCVLPWASACWNDLGKTLATLSLGGISPALRPSPRELHSFLSALPVLESLRLDKILSIYPPAGSLSGAAVPEISLPRLEFLTINENSVPSMAAFLGAVVRERSDCSLNVTYETRHQSARTLPTHIVALAAAASSFLRLPSPPASTAASSPIVLPHPLEKHSMVLRESTGHSLTLELRSATSDIAICKVFVLLDAQKASIGPAPFSQPPSPALSTTPLPTVEDDNEWAAVLPLIFSHSRPVHSFEVDSAAFQHPRPWLWSFAAAPASAPSHVTARGPAAFGLLAALVLSPPAELPLLLPPEFDAAPPAPADGNDSEEEARLALHAMTHCTLRAVDFTEGFEVALASTLEARAASRGVAGVECIRIERCGVTEAQVDALRSCPAVGRVEWDGLCTVEVATASA
ncbi:hypothetical protein PENSPDRAFT_182536 [Peniophora sp. CONT]|nr:hypothetical protein PENSPDRAFT_182536 [Peniophora sp. CONT]